MYEDINFWLLKAKGKNDNFSACDDLLWEGLQRLEKLKVMHLVALNVDPHSLSDVSWRIRV